MNVIKFNHLFQDNILKNLILVLLFSVVQNTFANSNLQTGDLIFHISTSSQSLAIQKATHSPYSHMGLIVNKHNQIWVLEAVQPVRYTTFNSGFSGENINIM